MGVEPAALLAVAEVESNGQVFATVNGADMPLIRWEGHYFHRLLPASLRAKAVKAGLAHPSAGGVKNPKTQQGRYDLLARAQQIDNDAALSSCSWGLGQVMGSHWQWLGYPSVQDLVDEAKSGVVGQVRLMVKYIEKAGLVDELQRLDWRGFARGYNGPNYDAYHTKMRNAYQRYGGASGGSASPQFPSLGAKGPEVSAIQESLRKLGYHLLVDGDFGLATRKAVMDFQRDHGLAQDGVVGPSTWSAITRLLGIPIGGP